MKALIIYADPHKVNTGTNSVISRALCDRLKARGVTYDYVDLYRSNDVHLIDENFFEQTIRNENPVAGPLLDAKIKVAQQVKNSTHIFIITSVWAGGFPSRLGDWLNQLSHEGITIVDANKIPPKGLVKSKVFYIPTAGGPKRYNVLFSRGNPGARIVKNTFSWMGAKEIKNVSIYNTTSKNDGQIKTEFLKKLSTAISGF